MNLESLHILALNRNSRNLSLLTQVLHKAGYQTFEAKNLEEFEQVLQQHRNIGLALLDITGFKRHLWQKCQILRDRGIPFLVISPVNSPALTSQCLAHGAQMVLSKPVVINELLQIIVALHSIIP